LVGCIICTNHGRTISLDKRKRYSNGDKCTKRTIVPAAVSNNYNNSNAENDDGYDR
jgi:hypothetical protein